MLPKKNYLESNIAILQVEQLLNRRKVQIDMQNNQTMGPWRINAIWEFDSRLRDFPRVFLKILNLSPYFIGKVSEPRFTFITTTPEICEFEIEFSITDVTVFYGGFTVLDLIAQIEVVADTRIFESGIYYSILNFFSYELRRNKFFGWLC